MAIVETGDIGYFTFEIFSGHGLKHGIFMRRGGVSPEPWRSLNTATSVGDVRENIVENRSRIFGALGRKVESLFDVWQVHSNDVVCTGTARPLEAQPQKADAIVTDIPEITLFMRFADCVPIFLFDPARKVIAIVHAGWKGTVNKIAIQAVEAMQAMYQTKPADILAGIGPSIGPDHYEVGPEVLDLVRRSFGEDANRLTSQTNGHTHLDLWEANSVVLRQAGVKEIQVAGICTGCNTGDWFSHRAEHGKTGRFGAIIAMEH